MHLDVKAAVLSGRPASTIFFAPVSYLKRWFRRVGSRGDREIADFLAENPELHAGHVLDVIASDQH